MTRTYMQLIRVARMEIDPLICGFALPVIDGSPKFIHLPEAGADVTRAQQAFGQACVAIKTEWHRRKGKEDCYGSAIQWLELVAYQLLSHVIELELEWLIDNRLREYDRYSRGNEKTEKPFLRGLIAIFADDRSHGVPGTGERSRIAQRLWYAFRHYVPHYFLRAFLGQVGTDDLSRKIADGIVEATYADWILAMRTVDERPHIRGAYSPEIEDQSSGLRNVLGPFRENSQRMDAYRARRRDQLLDD